MRRNWVTDHAKHLEESASTRSEKSIETNFKHRRRGFLWRRRGRIRLKLWRSRRTEGIPSYKQDLRVEQKGQIFRLDHSVCYWRNFDWWFCSESWKLKSIDSCKNLESLRERDSKENWLFSSRRFESQSLIANLNSSTTTFDHPKIIASSAIINTSWDRNVRIHCGKWYCNWTIRKSKPISHKLNFSWRRKVPRIWKWGIWGRRRRKERTFKYRRNQG